MVLSNSIKLFGSNWSKTLKYFLYYIVVSCVCVALLLPVFFEFKAIFSQTLSDVNLSYIGAFTRDFGASVQTICVLLTNSVVLMFHQNLGIACYALIVIFIFLPILINLGKFTFCEMLYNFMASNTKVGFFSAFIKTLKKSIVFAVCKMVYDWFFFAVILFSLYGFSLVGNTFFVDFLLVPVLFVFFVLMTTLNQILMLGWVPASCVFDCNTFSAFKKGVKAVKRHFWAVFGTTILFYTLFWGLTFVCGVYSLAVLSPLMSALSCIYDMTVFFSSQGMRFYVNNNKILTPKKLEEVEKINKTAFIL